jgi:crotonobetainyl-CoA:carnitine CoA-transferase CaiB-like acyl-CoA transferase
MATAMLLYRRAQTGLGGVVDIALYEPLMFILGDMILNYTSTGFIQQRVGNGTGSASPRGVYQAADGGWLSIAASNQGIARRLFTAMERPDLVDDPRFATNEARMANNDAIQKIVSGWVAARPRAEVLALLERHEVVCSTVNDAADVARDPHFLSRTLRQLGDSPVFAGGLIPGPVAHVDRYQGPEYAGVPAIGEHTDSYLREQLEIGEEQLNDLRAAGVIGSPLPAQ